MPSVNPNDFMNGPNAGPTAIGDNTPGMSANGVNVPNTPIPSSNPVSSQDLGTNQEAKGLAQLTKATTEGDKAIAAAAKSGGGGGGGGIFGAIGSILGGLFADGGMVGDQQKSNDLATGYLIGALHQRDFGGDPNSLEQAAHMIRQMLGSQNPTPSLDMMNREGEMNAEASGQPNVPETPQKGFNQGRGFADGGMSTNNPGMQPLEGYQPPMMPQPTQMPQDQQKPMGYAQGGPPLQPGQAFQGDGEVKGPGGPTDDAIPAKLSNGEFVMSAPATAFFGVDKLAKMNEQGKQGFMQAKQQVDMNQQQGAGNAPGASPMAPSDPNASPAGMMAPPPSMPPQMPKMAQGGAATVRANKGYCGL